MNGVALQSCELTIQYAVASGSADLTIASVPELVASGSPNVTLGSCPIPEATLPQRWTSKAGVPGAPLQSCKAEQNAAPSPVPQRIAPSDIIMYGQPTALPKAPERHRRLAINIDDLPPTTAVLTSIAVAAVITSSAERSRRGCSVVPNSRVVKTRAGQHNTALNASLASHARSSGLGEDEQRKNLPYRCHCHLRLSNAWSVVGGTYPGMTRGRLTPLLLPRFEPS